MPIVIIGNNTGDDFSGTIDAELYSASPDSNNSTTASKETTKYAAGDHRNSLYKFTGLSNITGPVTVNDAYIQMYCGDFGGTNPQTITAKRLLRNWVESEVTWNSYSSGNSWETAGGYGAGDISSTTSATASVTGTGNASFTGTQIDTDVENFINGSVSNYGWHMTRTDAESDSSWCVWRSADWGESGTRPRLYVDYSTSSDPEGSLIHGKLINGGLLFQGVLTG